MVNRFGISRGVSPRETFDQVAEIAKAIETNDFEALWFIDHQLGMKDVYTAMNVSAMATKNPLLMTISLCSCQMVHRSFVPLYQRR